MSAFVQRCCSLALSLRSRLATPPAAARSAAPAAMSKYYAVRVGSQPGIYRSWAECESKARDASRDATAPPHLSNPPQVRGVKGAVHKSFATLALAEAFMGGASAGGGGAAAFKAPAARAASPPRPAKKRGRASSPQRGGARARVGVCSLAGVAQEEGTYVLQFDGGARCAPAASPSPRLTRAAATLGPAARARCSWRPAAAARWPRPARGWATPPTTRPNTRRSSPDCVWRRACPPCAACWWRAVRPSPLDPGRSQRPRRADSTLVTRQMTGEWRVEARGLQPLWAAARAAAAHFEACTFRYIPREENAAVRSARAYVSDNHARAHAPLFWPRRMR